MIIKNDNNGNTIICVESNWEKANVVDALRDLDISLYLIDDTSCHDRVIVRDTFSQNDLDDLTEYLDSTTDCDSEPLFSTLFGYISPKEDFCFETASIHGVKLAQFA